MENFFILGNHPALSAAELTAVFPDRDWRFIPPSILLAPQSDNFDPGEVIKSLGGTIKIGKLIGTAKERQALDEIIKQQVIPGAGKFKFGISYYGPGKFSIKELGMSLKNYWQGAGQSCRWVTSRETVLSSVVVSTNKLDSKGAEIVIFKTPAGYCVGRTLAVQPFRELSFRDYGRPARDDRSGMLPPKLAQIMINLAGIGKHSVVLDPFCGSGTILGEALLMGYDRLIGSDISAKAMRDSRENLRWLKQNFSFDNTTLSLHELDSAKLSDKLPPGSIDAIVTEPYLGPQRGHWDRKKVIPELERLYGNSLEEFYRMLKPDGRVVMIWPLFQGKYELNPRIGGFRIAHTLSGSLRDAGLRVSSRETLVYGRPGQKVWREVVLLTKNEK